MPDTFTIEELAKKLRDMAVLTAQHSKNWDNFEQIALDMLKAVREQRI